MKRLLFVSLLLLAGLLFAQGGQSTIKDAMKELQSTTQSFLGVAIMLMLVAAVPLGLLAAGIYLLKVKGNANPGPWKIAMFVFAGLAALAIIGTVFGMAIYLLLPAILKALMPA